MSYSLDGILILQRLIAADIPVSRIPSVGVELSQGLFVGTNFTTSALTGLQLLLVRANRIVLDIYWNNGARIWQLCPQAFSANQNGTGDVLLANGVTCSYPPISFDTVLQNMKAFVDSQPGASLPYYTVVLNLFDLSLSAVDGVSSTHGSLSESINTNFEGAVLTPSVYGQFVSEGGDHSPYYTYGGTVLSANVFPTLSTMQKRSWRFVFAFGTNQLTNTSGYTQSSDFSVVFSASQMNAVPVLTSAAINYQQDGSIANCVSPASGIAMNGTGFDLAYAKYSATNASVQQVLSWDFAFVRETASNPFTQSTVTQLSRCGFSPLFIKNITDPLTNASIWNWNYGQPTLDNNLNCAVIFSNTSRWTNTDCYGSFRAACRNSSEPYSWSISQANSTFDLVGCPTGLQFDAPHTPLENMALVDAMAAANLQTAWVNYYQTTPRCWVVGSETQCPIQQPSTNAVEVIGENLVSSIFIVLLFLLFLAYQGRSQLHTSRDNRRKAEVRRKIKQMEYQSVKKME